jgi:hypothetical protein
MKHLIEIKLPGGNRFLIALRVKESGGCTSPALFDGFPLNFCSCPGIDWIVSEQSTEQIANRLTYVVN